MNQSNTSGQRAVLYGRVSTDKQAREGASLEVQEQLARERCQREGWELAAIYTDVESGRSDKRPEFNRLLKDAKGGHFEILIVYRTDRLARSTLKLLQVAADLSDCGMGLVSLTEPLDMSSTYGKAMFQLNAVFAELESANTGARVRDAMRHRAASTGKHIGPTPDGYRRRDDSVLEPDPARAPYILEVFERYAETRSMRATVEAMNGQGIPSQTGAKWRSATLRTTLANPAYAGRLAYGRHEVKRNSKGTKRRVLRDPSEWVVVEDAHEAIVPPELFDRCQVLLKERAAMHPRVIYGQRKYAWSGILRCGTCGSAMAADRGPDGWAHYRCGLRLAGGKTACSQPATVGIPALEKHAILALDRALVDAMGAAGANARRKPPTRKAPRVLNRADKVKQLQHAIKMEADIYRAKGQSYDQMQANIERLNAEIAALEAKPAEEPTAPIAPPPIANLRELWESLDAAHQGELLRDLLERIEVHQDLCRLIPKADFQWSLGEVILCARKKHAPTLG